MTVSDLYLTLPTYGEFVFATSRFNNYFLALEIPKIDRKAWISLLTNKFYLPHCYKQGIGLDSDLAEIVSEIEDGTSYNDFLPENGTYEHHYSLMERLCPGTTAIEGNGDCKSLAVISVAYKRHHGIPARFLMPTKDHLIFEEHDGKEWIPKDPQMGIYSLPMTTLVKPVTPIPNPELYEKAYLAAIRLYSRPRQTQKQQTLNI